MSCFASSPMACPWASPDTRKPPRIPGRIATSRVTATGAREALAQRSAASSWLKRAPLASRLNGSANTRSCGPSCAKRACTAAAGMSVRYSTSSRGWAAKPSRRVSTWARLVRLWSCTTTMRRVAGSIRRTTVRLLPTFTSSNTPPIRDSRASASERLIATPENNTGTCG